VFIPHYGDSGWSVAYMSVREDVMTLQEQDQDLESVLPDLRELPLERLAELGDSVLAHSVVLYRQRLKENGVPFYSFTARI
jgi:hypothetical protein